jgi:hypothetical protein
MPTTSDRVRFPQRGEIIAIVLAVVPFAFSVYSVNIINGRITGRSEISDVILGIALIFVVWRNTFFIREGEAKYKVIRIILTAVLFALAAFHIASGLGLLVSLPYPFGYGA